ncbi:DnaJ domain containing protein [Cryptosporidium felis]|nr:DnaJ domain containing protein [Cryptosporidium felis]
MNGNPTNILSPGFKKVRVFNNLSNNEKKIYNIISTFFLNNEIIHPLSKLVDFFDNQNDEKIPWKEHFIVLCLFLDHQTLKLFTKGETKDSLTRFQPFRYNNTNINSETKLNGTIKVDNSKKRNCPNIDDKENQPAKKKNRKMTTESELNASELLNNQLLHLYENVCNLFNQHFINVANENNISDNSITLEKSFYFVIGLKYTYYSTSFFNNSSRNAMKRLINSGCSHPKLVVFEELTKWCLERISKREFISNKIICSEDKNDLESILRLPPNTPNIDILSQCDNLLKWLSLPLEDVSDSPQIHKSYVILKEARSRWESSTDKKPLTNPEINTEKESFLLARSSSQKMIIQFIIERYNEQKNKWHNPFWTLGVNPKRFKPDEISSIRKKLLLLTHPDKIIDKDLKHEANEAHIIIRESIEQINNIFKYNPDIISSLPKGPELSYDFDSCQEKFIKCDTIPEIVKLDLSIIRAIDKEIVKLPPKIKLCVKLNVNSSDHFSLKVHISYPLVGSSIVEGRKTILENVFITHFLKINRESDRENFRVEISDNCIYLEVSDLLYVGYPGITENSYYIGVQVILREYISNIVWKKIITKLPSETEINKGFSKNEIKKYLELYCKSWGNERKLVQNLFTAAKLWNIIDNTTRKTELVKVLIALMENSYKCLISMH